MIDRCHSWSVLVSGLVLVLALAGGCKETTVAPDASIPPPDVGAKNCDAPANNWQIVDIGTAPQLGDSGVTANLFGVWGDTPKSIFAVGSEGKVLFFDGKTWTTQKTPTVKELTSVWGTSAKDVWAVGFEGTVIHFDGVTWQDRSPPIDVFVEERTEAGLPKGDAAVKTRRNLWGVWAGGATATEALYAVGDHGLVLYLKGNVWSRVPSGVEDNLFGVWGSSVNKIYIAGDFGTILAGNNTAFTKASTGISKPLHRVWGRGDGDVWVVGLTGMILHSDGSAWTQVAGAPKQYLKGVWGPNNESTVYIVGIDGTLIRITGGAGSPTVAGFNCVTARRLESIWGLMVPPPVVTTEAGVPVPKDGGLVPSIWIAGASGTIITGP
jgi:hypothetical protein